MTKKKDQSHIAPDRWDRFAWDDSDVDYLEIVPPKPEKPVTPPKHSPERS